MSLDSLFALGLLGHQDPVSVSFPGSNSPFAILRPRLSTHQWAKSPMPVPARYF